MSRLGYVDWLRGLAVLLMMQTHAYDSWLAPAAKHTPFFGYSRLLGGAPAPLFLFLAGLSLGLLVERRPGEHRRGVRQSVRRGLQILGYAFAFRLGLLVTGGFTRPSDFFRVDVLNGIGLSMVVVATLGFSWSTPSRRAGACLLIAAAIAAATPLVWDAPWPSWVPRVPLGYLSGRVPDSFFPLFPWTAFTAAGGAAGIVLMQARAAAREAWAVLGLALAGAGAVVAGLRLDRLPTLYPRYDFWYTSPNYVLIRLGLALVLLGLAFAWDRRPWPRAAGPLIVLGRDSLLIYVVHIELVYGGIVVPFLRGRQGVPGASLALALLTLAMWLLAYLHTRQPSSSPDTLPTSPSVEPGLPQ